MLSFNGNKTLKQFNLDIVAFARSTRTRFWHLIILRLNNNNAGIEHNYQTN